MRAASRAFVVHRTPTRLRIKIPERQMQDAYFAALRRALLQHADVLAVQTNALAASVVIECRDGSAFLTRNHRFPGLEPLPVEAHEPPPTRLPAVTYRTQGATGWTDGALDWPAVFIKLLVALVTKQLEATVPTKMVLRVNWWSR
jgi:hypothetical protein